MMLANFCNKVIEYSFYALFFFVPLVFAGNTSELFEFNKMWLTFGLAIIIGAAWLSKMVLQRKFTVQRTPLDIPILLFLLSQSMSTLFSLDQHVSWWGYYSRFNGGLLSTVSYIFLYYALVSNLQIKQTLRLLRVSLLSGLIVVLWGLPSHFGFDPTCYVFRGSLDISCWTYQFVPTIRAFSTLGQPAWFAAYLVILIPLALGFFLKNLLPLTIVRKNHEVYQKNQEFKDHLFLNISFLVFAALLYLCLIFANTRAGFVAFGAIDVVFWVFLFLKKVFSNKKFLHYLVMIHVIFLLCNFFFGFPIESLDRFTLRRLMQHPAAQTAQSSPSQPNQAAKTPTFTPPSDSVNGNGITDSGQIRLNVWQGAISAWKDNPLFGTGVETFAFAYYKYKPIGHNLTSEWDYLYNKAHNEYLNYLTTTGVFGLGSYLAIITWFFWVLFKKKNKILSRNHEQDTDSSHDTSLFLLALLCSYISILVSDFFGFSVVIINLYLFLIPAFVFVLGNFLNPQHVLGSPVSSTSLRNDVNPLQWTGVGVLIIIAGYLLLGLMQYWSADVEYALGSNLDKAEAYQQAYPHLLQAATAEKDEPVYADEFSINLGTLAASLFLQKQTATAQQLEKNAVALSDQVVASHPNNVVYWKDRVRLFYTLAQGDPANQQQYLAGALQAIQKAYELAPNDAKISYNLGVLLGQTGNVQQSVAVLEHAIQIKPDYRDAYFALALMYHDVAIDKKGKVTNPDLQQKAVDSLQNILQHLDPNDKVVKDTLKSWSK